jgi:titin
MLDNVPGHTLVYRDTTTKLGFTYFYGVSAETRGGEGPKSSIVSATPIGPAGPPMNLGVLEDFGQITLTWEAPEDDGGTPIIEYLVKRGEASNDLRELDRVEEGLSFVDTSVVDGIDYYYAVFAVNEVGEGTPTEVVTASPKIPPTIPGEPFDLTVEKERNQVVLRWTPPSTDGGSPISGYWVYRSSSPSEVEPLVELGNVTEYTDTDVKPGKTYYYSVAAKNIIGKGESTPGEKVKIPAKKDDGPGFALIISLLSIVIVAIFSRNRTG